MKKFINDPDDVVDEMLEGFLAVHKKYVRKLETARTVVRADAPVAGKVGIVTGGGSEMAPFDVAVSAVPYEHNPALTTVAIDAGCHLVDLGGNPGIALAGLHQFCCHGHGAGRLPARHGHIGAPGPP